MTSRHGFHRPLMGLNRLTYGAQMPDPQPLFLWAFAYQDDKPRVHQFPDTETGREDLAQLLRSDQVIRVVHGSEVITTSENLVVVRAPQGTYTDRHQARITDV